MDQQNQKRPNSGYFFPNKDKRTEKQPDWRGKYNDSAGKEWLASGWNRNKDGDNMISFQFTDPSSLPARDAAAPGAARPATAPAGGARGPMARPVAPSPSPASPPKAFQPSKVSGATQSDLEDLDSLFQGFDDDLK